MPEAIENNFPEIGNSIKIGATTINYHDRGDGAVVLLIHGSGPGVTAWANWRNTIPALEGNFRVIAPDMAGFGYTETTDVVECSVERWAKQLCDLLDALEIGQISIVGNSFGGSIALEFIRQYPERCSKAILMGSVGVSFPLTEGLDTVWGYQPSFDHMKHLLELFVADESLITDDLVEMRYRASLRPGVQERFERLFPEPRQRWVDALAQQRDDLRSISNKLLLIHGRDDKIIPIQASEQLHKLLPNSTLRRIDDCGHWVQIEQAQRFNSIVLDFLTGSLDKSFHE
ncbi:alpha/beta fold hydrolase [Candidatus Nitrotoga sp. M5]|uniref:alpha/beta fold hydrolase n=1 Tax=Candidatus Nitrotoga sp. M5 TaxID=2890409 RepID=UPI001EF72353|nr:alpha/beta hydrolase [Candidatus Nitrotoga sp. M5]CAH1387945.1 2-hydroxy-6-oxo-2,4-heptadienoate hydrolase [Candidatus Nitrotoga sp. M5]